MHALRPWSGCCLAQDGDMFNRRAILDAIIATLNETGWELHFNEHLRCRKHRETAKAQVRLRWQTLWRSRSNELRTVYVQPSCHSAVDRYSRPVWSHPCTCSTQMLIDLAIAVWLSCKTGQHIQHRFVLASHARVKVCTRHGTDEIGFNADARNSQDKSWIATRTVYSMLQGNTIMHTTREVHKDARWQKCCGQKHMLSCKLQSKAPGPQSKDWIASATLNIADLHNMHIM